MKEMRERKKISKIPSLRVPRPNHLNAPKPEFHTKTKSIETLTRGPGVGDDDPKVDGLLPPELLVVPLLLDPHRAVRLDRHPWVLVANAESFVLRLLN